jgi:hypothetical protein
MSFKLNELELNEKKHLETLCKGYYKSLKCKSCKKHLQINSKLMKISKKKPNKITNKTIKLWQKYGKICDKCTSSKNTKRCNPKQLKKYSNWYYYGKQFNP